MFGEPEDRELTLDEALARALAAGDIEAVRAIRAEQRNAQLNQKP